MTLLVNETATAQDKFWEYFDFGTSINNTDDIIDVVDGGPVLLQAPELTLELTIYSVLLVIGALGNVTVLVSLLRSRRRKSRVNLLMTHLVVADMIVVFIVIPLEIGWKLTNAWLAGNYACKVFLVLRAFGLYLSSNILVCISIDRFFAVLYPLRLHVARRRSKRMLHLSWIIAFICSLPQSKVFSVKSHPEVPEFHQCVSFGAFASPQQELVYNILCIMAMYFIPLLVITGCYARIFWEISKNSKEIYDKYSEGTRVQLRRSDERPLARARRRTLKMTVTIVTVFACCWLPYAIMTLWYMLDRKSAEHVPAKIQSLFFVMAVSNSCMDPLVYGSYALDLKTFIRKTLLKIYHLHENSPENPSTLKTKGSNALPLIENVIQKKPSRIIAFQETSFSKPAEVCSDPVQVCHECLSPALKPSRSHEMFTLQSLNSRTLSKRSVDCDL